MRQIVKDRESIKEKKIKEKSREEIINKIIEENFSRLQNTEIFILEGPAKYSAV